MGGDNDAIDQAIADRVADRVADLDLVGEFIAEGRTSWVVADESGKPVTVYAHEVAADRARRHRARIIAAAIVVLVASVATYAAWQWSGSAPVPLVAERGEFGSAVDVGTPVHQAVYGSNTADALDIADARPVLGPGSAPAALGVSLCRRAPDTALLSSHFGSFPAAEYCTALEPWDGQTLEPHDYLVVTAVPVADGTVTASLEVRVRDGIRRGEAHIDLSPFDAVPGR